MANKYLTASGAFGSSGQNRRVYKVTLGATDSGLLILKSGGSGGTNVFAVYSSANNTRQVTVPGIKADYATITGTAPHATIEF